MVWIAGWVCFSCSLVLVGLLVGVVLLVAFNFSFVSWVFGCFADWMILCGCLRFCTCGLCCLLIWVLWICFRVCLAGLFGGFVLWVCFVGLCELLLEL